MSQGIDQNPRAMHHRAEVWLKAAADNAFNRANFLNHSFMESQIYEQGYRAAMEANRANPSRTGMSMPPVMPEEQGGQLRQFLGRNRNRQVSLAGQSDNTAFSPAPALRPHFGNQEPSTGISAPTLDFLRRNSNTSDELELLAKMRALGSSQTAPDVPQHPSPALDLQQRTHGLLGLPHDDIHTTPQARHGVAFQGHMMEISPTSRYLHQQRQRLLESHLSLPFTGRGEPFNDDGRPDDNDRRFNSHYHQPT